MGKPGGFLEHSRELPPEQAPLERIKHWEEFHLNHGEERLLRQAARCLDCGTPFCHAGILLRGMAVGCPLRNLIPEWNDLVYRGLWREALERLLATNNFPEFTGRVCPAPCEGSCTLGLHNAPVTIKAIELAIIERGFEEGWVKPRPPAQRTGKRVAVIGSGPAGLACADQLNKAGHTVTVFERADRIGGLLMYGIPNMKLDKRIVQRRLDLMAAEGVKFVVNVEVGKNYPVEKLSREFHAIVLCGGATRPRDLNIPGRELAGIHFAVEYLHGNTKHLLDEQHGDVQMEGAFGYPYISAEGKDVVVIGGGDTGTDCVATALRQGCRSVTQLEILPRPPDTRQPDNPWPEWPKVYRMDYGHQEHYALHGSDPRRFLTTATRFEGDERGHVRAVHTVRVEWVKDEKGRLTPRPIHGTEEVYPAQLVLLAMGFLGPETSLLDQLGVERDERGNVRTAPGRYATSVPGIFVAGDMHRGQSLVVWAIREGREAAQECDRFLREENP